ncbi:concanavalin A-like lectin/glucanase domain-containing protein [Tuber brumale]|nr:concanavalin A-like lectin/glucanase domain-containing protein [Tuber brumale]
MRFSIVASILLNAYAAVAADFCGQWDSVTTSNNYIIYNNLWGVNSATSGSQCTGLDSASGKSVAWHTTWSWTSGLANIKSFPNANLVFTPKTIADIGSIKSTMKYSYTSTTGAVANVAYDLFTSRTAGSDISEYEVMIWLAAYGNAGPISSTGSPIATPTIAGYRWKLYDGFNSNMHVYSFVAVDSPLTRFACDVKLFLTYLADNYALPTSQYLNILQAGTEPTAGSNAKFAVSAFSAVVA